jgi:hypothetical protein
LEAQMTNQEQRWPALPVTDWEPTYDTLHMYTQIIGKISLALRPMTNHWWQVALELSVRGLRTAAIPHAAGTFEMDLDTSITCAASTPRTASGALSGWAGPCATSTPTR